MLRVLEAQVPPKQTVDDTISTLSSRLSNATLLEDRRAAILGLRSFAKEYPASVASGALRGLISTLSRDADDVDTDKSVLETLLMLFNPNATSLEASEDITFWLADEFSQRQDNITILLDFLEQPDFYTRIYSLQLLAAISSARPERTQECILSAPLGTARLVAILDDPREAIRSAGLSLLNDVTQASAELQKIVAFENAFDRIFALIKIEGGLKYGGIVVQDCISLLANLLHLNAANQSLFRETGFVPKLGLLLNHDPKDDDSDELVGDSNATKDKNLWGLLAVIRLFVVPGNMGTQANQMSFEKHGLLQRVLDLVFEPSSSNPIRAEALHTCADMIRSNGRLQEQFAHILVNPKPQSKPVSNGDVKNSGSSKIHIIEALLDLTLTPAPSSLFDVRFASCICIQAYFYNHLPIRLHFLRRALEGHASGEDETSNIFNIMMGGLQSYQSSDPYRLWFASLLTFHLIFDAPEAKKLAMSISEGDAEKGEEVVTCIQAITGNLVTSLQNGEDDRIAIGYLMLLCGWLYDDADSVNDFLSEGSALGSLVSITSKNDKDREVVKGLCTFLCGVTYEFSTKDSPIPRRNLQPLLIKGLGREQYVQKITRFREHPILRDFEVTPQGLASTPSGTLPKVFFDQTFVDFIKDNFSRVIRAIDRDPGLEVARLQEGIDRDLVDSLRSQIANKDEALQKAESDLLTLERKLAQEQAELRRTQETSNAELGRIKSINGALHKSHDAAVDEMQDLHRKELEQAKLQHKQQTDNSTTKTNQIRKELASQLEQVQVEASKNLESLTKQHNEDVKRLEKQNAGLELATKQSTETIETLQKTNDSISATLKQREATITSLQDAKTVLEESTELRTVNLRKLEEQIREHEKRLKDSVDKYTKAQDEASKAEEGRKSAQTELDDLLIVLGDLEDKRARDKKKLKELGQETSDDEGDEDDEDEEDDEEVENEVE